MKSPFTVFLALACALAWASAAPQETSKPVSPSGAERAQVPAPKPPWGRVVLVGASVSAGFTETEPFGGPKTRPFQLSRYLDAALLVPHEPVRSFAHSMFFLQPAVEARRQLGLALQSKPTLLAGLDFLFWFCYGDGNTDAERLQRFEGGLKLLEAVSCPLVIGDIPDASGAVDTALSRDQIPSPAAIAAANRRLKEWVAGRRQVTLVPLSQILRAASANQSLTVHGQTLPAGQTRRLLQPDKLHPSPLGTALLAITVLDAFASKQASARPEDICWQPETLLRVVLERLQPTNGVASSQRLLINQSR